LSYLLINKNKNINNRERIKKLKGYHYNYKSEIKDKNFINGRQIGFIAQELKEIFPELVSEMKDGYLAVNYSQFSPILLEAIKEQQSMIEKLQIQLDDQRQYIENLVKTPQVVTSGVGVLGKENYSLAQNIPNPFTHETIINYNLPREATTANLAIYDLSGKQIISLPLEINGATSMKITAEKIPAGIYIYSIIVDSQIFDSKKMVIVDK
jgi:hypothetical protein